MKYPTIPSNPIVDKLLEQKPTGIIELAGYAAPHDKGPVRIYRDLTLERYVEIPRDAILHFSESENPQSPSKVYFKSTATVTYAKKTQVSASASATGTLSVLADEVERTARGRVIQSGLRHSCPTTTSETVYARRTAPGPGDIELPPLWCEINCEQWLNACLDAGMSAFWCWLDYYVCRLGCIFESPSPGDVIFRLA